MKKIFIPLFIVALTAACTVGCGGKKAQEITPQVTDLTEAVYASGSLVPEEEYRVMAPLEGNVQASYIHVGDTVHKGMLLFSIANANNLASLSAAEGVVARTLPLTNAQSPQVRELQSRISVVEARLQNDSIQYERYARLIAQKAVSMTQFEQRKLQYENTRRELESLKQQVAQVTTSSALQMQQAQNQLQLAQTVRGNGQVKSFDDGVIYEVFKYIGDWVNPSQALATIGKGKLIVKLLVDENDLGKISLGQRVMITMDAFPNRVFQAQITRVYPMLNRVEQSVRVDAVLTEALPKAIYGLNVEANIVVGEHKNVTVLPKSVLLAGDSVWVKLGDSPAKIKLQLGATDGERVQVKSGLPAGAVVLSYAK